MFFCVAKLLYNSNSCLFVRNAMGVSNVIISAAFEERQPIFFWWEGGQRYPVLKSVQNLIHFVRQSVCRLQKTNGEVGCAKVP